MALPTLADLPKSELIKIIQAAGVDKLLTEKEITRAVYTDLLRRHDLLRRAALSATKPIKKNTSTKGIKRALALRRRYLSLTNQINNIANEYAAKYGEDDHA